MAKNKTDDLVGIPEPLTGTYRADDIIRDRNMFVAWIKGSTMTQLATDFNMSFDNVRRIAKKYNWKQLAKEYARRALAASMTDATNMAALVVKTLMRDYQKLAQACLDENRQMTKEERDHSRGIIDRVWKELRLEDGKPTENTGVLSVELRLPKGVTGFGIFPPDERVKYVEAKDQEEKPVIDLDELEGDSK